MILKGCMIGPSGSQTKIIIFKTYLRNTIRVSNSFDPDQVLRFVWSDPCPIFWQRLSVEDTSNEKGKASVVFHTG